MTGKLTIEVDGQRIEETDSEKLLGVIINNKLYWKDHLYGDKDNSGLINQLKQRVGTLRRLSKYMSTDRLKMMVSENVLFAGIQECAWPSNLQRQQGKVSGDDSD